ncbi:MAG: ferrous iron transport protein B, partial [Nitrospiraceae bacterium]|nr:ferrous iron transport protein B [Nitrospiraceae bacterium]
MGLGMLLRKVVGGNCCEDRNHVGTGLPKILIVGNPNVGKSVLFNRLTGRYVTVSNYPGTTVEVARGRSRVLDGRFEVVDTPGMYSLSPITEEERVACRLLLNEPAQAVLHVIDAKNIQRMLGLTLQLIEAGLVVVLVLNMVDEARRLGIRIDTRRLGELLRIPVVETVATTGEGIGELAVRIGQVQPAPGRAINYGGELERAVSEVAAQMENAAGVSARTRALLLLQEENNEIENLLGEQDAHEAEAIRATVSAARGRLEHSPHYYATLATRQEADRILSLAGSFPARGTPGFREKLSRFCMHPLTGIPLLLAVLYFGLYKFVGGFGAGTVVGFLEDTVFGKGINPWINRAAEAVIPWQVLRELFAGQYGIITLGVRYAVAIILPIVGTFFLAFSILEDSGYLPRLAMLIDRVFKKIGLNGRAVIPIVLGFGCDTMATIVTRTLETRRERIIASFLLALAIPCSAQLGVILGLLAGHPYALLVWAGAVALIFLTAGLLAARLLPGRGPSFYMELPPLRLPKLTNVAVKTYTRIVWYFKEVFPLFILASVFIWIGRVTGLFNLLVRGLEPVVNLIGLPDEAAVAFLFGFFRRDYGAAGLYDLQKSGALSGVQLAVAAIT